MDSHLLLVPRPAGAGSPLRVLLACRQPVMRDALRQVLDDTDNVQLVAEAGDLASARRHLDSSRTDVLAVDRGLLADATIATIHELRERWPSVQLVILTSDDNAAFAEHTVAAGALGLVLKQFADSELPTAVHTVAGGDEYVSPRIVRRADPPRRAHTAVGAHASGNDKQRPRPGPRRG